MSWRTLGSRVVYENPWIRVREDDVVQPDGSESIYGVVELADFAVVVPFDGEAYTLVEQFRYPVGRREWEFPQGGWSHGKSGPPEQLAALELREETGFAAGALTHLGRLYAAYGFSSQAYDVFLAEELVAGEAAREITEADMICEWRSLPDIRAMIGRGEFADAHSVAALALYDLRP